MTAKNFTTKERGKQLIAKVGYNSKGRHKAFENKIYDIWRQMLRRCYDRKAQEKRPTYIGCSVDERWHDFQDFADWYVNHEYYGFGYQLDKDVLTPNNKIYSPETCCFVPSEINNLLLDRSNFRGEHPQGVSLCRTTGKYFAQIAINSNNKKIGAFLCPNEAHQAYVVAKEAYVKEKAIEWKDRIEDRVFNALMAWRVES